VVVVAASAAGLLLLAVQHGVSRQSAVLGAFFLAAAYVGVQLVLASRRHSRAHARKLADLAAGSDRPGGADPTDERRQ
jgi:hypothetical protein